MTDPRINPSHAGDLPSWNRPELKDARVASALGLLLSLLADDAMATKRCKPFTRRELEQLTFADVFLGPALLVAIRANLVEALDSSTYADGITRYRLKLVV